MKSNLNTKIKDIYVKLKNNKIFGKIINILLNILIVLFSIILLISVYNTIQIKIFGNKYVNFFGYSIFEIQTDSMAKEIYANDWIVVEITDKIELNDIITYEQGGKFITHRVVEIYNDTYITKGEANKDKDEPIVKDQIVGKVVKVLSNFGALRKTIFDKQVLFFTILFLAIINLMFNDKKRQKLKLFQKVVNNDEIGEKKEEMVIVEQDKQATTDVSISNIENDKEENVVSVEEDNNQEEINNIENDIIVLNPDIDINENVNLKEEETSSLGPFLALENEVTEEQNIIIDEDKEPTIKIEAPNIISISSDEITKTLEAVTPNIEKVDVEQIVEEAAINVENEDSIIESEPEKMTVEELIAEGEMEVPATEETSEIMLDLLKRKSKKCKNIIEKIMYMEKEQLTELVNVFLLEENLVINEATIRSIMLDTYINAKYYNVFEDDHINKTDTRKKKIEKTLTHFSNHLVSSYKGSDKKYDEKVAKYLKVLLTILDIEWVNESTSEINEKNSKYTKIVEKYYIEQENTLDKEISEIIRTIKGIKRNYVKAINYLLKKIDTSLFELQVNQFLTNKNMYGVELNHNIKFSNTYSDYIIDETYSTGIIAEDKMEVLLNMLLIKVVEDMISAKFNKKYVLYIPKTLYKKSNKLANFFKLFDDEYAKKAAVILITLEDLIKYKRVIRIYRKKGYSFGLILNPAVTVDGKSFKYINLVDYVFINSDKADKDKFKNLIPDDLNNVIYEDIIEKIGELKERNDF